MHKASITLTYMGSSHRVELVIDPAEGLGISDLAEHFTAFAKAIGYSGWEFVGEREEMSPQSLPAPDYYTKTDESEFPEPKYESDK